jgi:hypothetical protein
VGPFLHRMIEEGLLSDARVLEAAKAKRSPLHKHFTWDNNIAAEKYRLREARNLIGAITFIIADGEETDPLPMRYFVNLPMQNEEGENVNLYVTMPVVHRNPDLEAEMLRIAARELGNLRDKYGRLKRLSEIVNWALLEELLAELA